VSLFKLFWSLGILTIAININAQLTGTQLVREIEKPDERGRITIYQEAHIDKVLDIHLYEEGKKGGIFGYRIRIFSNSGAQARKQGEVIMAGFIYRYEGVDADFIFDSPFYSLYVGNFRTHSEAMKFLKEIEKYYPDAFIVRSKIDYPKL
jgi:ABC-type enterochelin transport system ATPase subunit